MPDRPDVEPQLWVGRFDLHGDGVLIASELAYHPRDGISLRTNELLEKPRQAREPRVHLTLNGFVEGSRRCTVVDAFETKIDGGLIEMRKIVGNAIVFDGEGEDSATPVYRRLNFSSPAFTALLNPCGIRPTPTTRSGIRKVSASPAPALEAPWGTNVLRLGTDLIAGNHQSNDGGYHMTERPFLEIEFAEPQTFDEVRRLVAGIEFLSCVGDGTFSGPPRLLLWKEPKPKARSRGKRSIKGRQAVLLAQDWYGAAEPKHWLGRTFVLGSLGLDPMGTLAQWLDLSGEVERSTSLYRTASSETNIGVCFLFLIQAVEGLHRKLNNRIGINQAEFDQGLKALRNAIPGNLSQDARDMFANRLPKDNEPGLSSRLKDYGDRVTRVLPNALPRFSKDRQAIAKLRNDFSHILGQEIKGPIDDHVRHLIYYCEVLKVLFVFLLLDHLAIRDECLIDIFDHQFKLLARRRADAGLP